MKSVEEQIAAAMKAKVYDVQADLVRETAIRAFTNISIATPVDTGRARANWNIATGQPNKETTVSAAHTDAEATATEALAGYDGKQTVYVSNHLPYIERLNEGSSTQAPANFVEQGVMLAKRQAEAAAKRGIK